MEKIIRLVSALGIGWQISSTIKDFYSEIPMLILFIAIFLLTFWEDKTEE